MYIRNITIQSQQKFVVNLTSANLDKPCKFCTNTVFKLSISISVTMTNEYLYFFFFFLKFQENHCKNTKNALRDHFFR